MKKYDILIIGGGPGGYVSAIRAAQLGAKVALIEKHKVGGICLNYGCIPTKAYLKSAKMFDLAQNIEQFGLKKNSDIVFDWLSILNRKNKIVQKLFNGINVLLKKNKIDLYKSFAEVLTPNIVQVGEITLETEKLIIATGSSAFIPPIPGVKESYENKYLYTSKELVNLEKFPKKIIIIGGGVIGIEFASIFNKFNSEVVIIERQQNILSNMDYDIVNVYAKKLKKDNIKIYTCSEVIKIENNKVYYKKDEQIYQDEADIILMAVGTKPNLDGIQKLNLKIERTGIVTDEFLRTSVEGVYAIGDVNGKYMLAHVASHEGIIAVSHALNYKDHLIPMDYNCVPYCVYGFPEIASIGLTEEQVKTKQICYKVSIFPASAIGKALADGETDGFAKVIVEKDSLKILGMHILSCNATELISEIGVAMGFQGTAHDIVKTIHPHPSLSEMILETFLGVIDKPIHM
ncbi:MAG: dihydrolipoyl dehydrogenase [Phytoplasma sp.]|uniref:dihydrolipoyl dehydrogenase n=1 Tax=Phytoplasma sp. TaxID=2155 RepID=UPI002B412D63|nr:dihydrolipoyl dehydrogenase [Phytoplasma sp.]WRH06552.1 MAG: dihydrolipoyl dehydrogenase [Phytoplasma sp.]